MCRGSHLIFCLAFPGRGVSFLEMLAMELKGDGLYVSRGLSFRCVSALVGTRPPVSHGL